MSSINPVILLPGALASRSREIAAGFVGALTLGAGQFCTNPGLLLAMEGPPLEGFLTDTAAFLGAVPAAPMLTQGIRDAYAAGVQRWASHSALKTLGLGGTGSGCSGQAALFSTDAASFLSNADLAEEVFGAAALVVRCRDLEELRCVVQGLEGQLTFSLQLADADIDTARNLIPLLERNCGRIVVNGFGTGVEVNHAMVHGGPFPATSDSRTTSVGTLAIRRFLRPVSYQDFPEPLLPDALKDGNPMHVRRLINGEYPHS
jgi:2,5-dioxopentanoate dehydrogenase